MILIRHDFEDPRGRKTPKGETKMMSALINSAVFPGIQGGPLEHVIASKAVAFGEALSDEYMEYIQQITGKMVENTLVLADITVNKNMVPFDTRSPFLTSGLRVGTPAITTRGLKQDKMAVIVELIDDVISDINPETKTASEAKISAVRAEVNKMMKDYPLFAW